MKYLRTRIGGVQCALIAIASFTDWDMRFLVYHNPNHVRTSSRAARSDLLCVHAAQIHTCILVMYVEKSLYGWMDLCMFIRHYVLAM
jgi:hypothetical protein